MVLLDSILFWTIVSAIAAVVAAVVAILTVWINRQKKKEKKIEALEKLKQVRNELCVAMNIGEINTLLNNAITLCDEKNSDSKHLNEVLNQLQPVLTDVESKWNSLKLQLALSENEKLSEQLYTVIQEYLFCFRDVETVVAALRCNNVDDVGGMVTSENSVEMREIIEATKPLYTDVYEFAKQVISLRFKDLDIPDFAAKIRQLWDDESRLPFNTNTRLLATIGNPMAQNAIGDYYYEQKQFKKAFIWYKKAAEQGLAQAQYSLGICYRDGDGVEKDAREVVKWYKKAAEQGLAQAQQRLGYCYGNGEGIEKDEKEAVKWYEKSAKQGEALAQNSLGVYYQKGRGVKKDTKEAVKWYEKAVEQNLDVAQCNLGGCYLVGEGVEKDEREAFKLYKKSAEQGYSIAQYNLGTCYAKGKGVEKNEREAVKWYKTAAEQDYANAQHNLGICFLYGGGVERDEREAVKWFKKAAEQGNPLAQFALGLCYDDGKGCDQDYNKAFYWYCKASESKEDIETYSKAMYGIGCMYEYGTIGMGNMGTAIGYYNIAAQYGYDKAQFKLGYCYEDGLGGKEVDIEKAKYWYEKSAEQGNEDAIESLAQLNGNSPE